VTIRANVIRALAVCALAAAAGCVGSRPVEVAAKPTLDQNNVLEFEFHGATVQLDSVRFSRDSVTGIPWKDQTRCCGRVAYAVADISAAKIRTFTPLGAILGGALAIVLFLGYEIARGAGGG
jgi:hypothetical protein